MWGEENKILAGETIEVRQINLLKQIKLDIVQQLYPRNMEWFAAEPLTGTPDPFTTEELVAVVKKTISRKALGMVYQWRRLEQRER